MRWSDIHDGYATIERSLIQTREGLQFKGTKTDNPRVLVIPTEAREALEAHRKDQNELRRQFGPTYRADLDLIFCNPDGSPMKPDSLSGTIRELFERLGIPKPKGSSLHLVRHTHASHLLASGAAIPAVSARLAHTSIRTTLGHLRPYDSRPRRRSCKEMGAVPGAEPTGLSNAKDRAITPGVGYPLGL